MRPDGEFTVSGRRHARLLLENTREVRHVVEAERIGYFSERMIVEFYEFQRFVYFKFCQIIHNRFVVILFENSADMRNAVIQVGGDSAGYCKSLKMIGAKAEPQIKFRSTYDGGDVYLDKLYN